jgi:uncharacterized membrane protein YkvA (DUF1232 family)
MDGLVGMSHVARWRERTRTLKAELQALTLACRDPRVPWYVRALAIGILAYAFSPIDLIPDPIPVLGYLDDLVLIPLGIALVIRLIPAEILSEHRATARATPPGAKPRNWVAAGVIVAMWVCLIVGAIWLMPRVW